MPTILSRSSRLHCASGAFRLIDPVRYTPFSVPTRFSPLRASKPSQTPSSNLSLYPPCFRTSCGRKWTTSPNSQMGITPL